MLDKLFNLLYDAIDRIFDLLYEIVIKVFNVIDNILEHMEFNYYNKKK